MKLHLGFENSPYPARYGAASPLSATIKRRKPKTLSKPQQNYGQGKTTGDVSKELEDKYKIVEAFVDMEEDYICDLIEEQAAMDLDEIMTLGEPSKKGMSFTETDKIEKKFRNNLSSRKYDGIISGVPTIASIKGFSHLRQHPYEKGHGSRASFVNTGLYSSSFRAWVEED